MLGVGEGVRGGASRGVVARDKRFEGRVEGGEAVGGKVCVGGGGGGVGG